MTTLMVHFLTPVRLHIDVPHQHVSFAARKAHSLFKGIPLFHTITLYSYFLDLRVLGTPFRVNLSQLRAPSTPSRPLTAVQEHLVQITIQAFEEKQREKVSTNRSC